MSRPRRKPEASLEHAEPTVRIAYKYRAYPTDSQQYRIENWFGTLCYLYNSAVWERKTSYRETGKGVSCTDQLNALPKQKLADPALRQVHSQVLQDCLQRVDKAFEKFFSDMKLKKSGKPVKIGYPRMKKLARYRSFTYPQV